MSVKNTIKTTISKRVYFLAFTTLGILIIGAMGYSYYMGNLMVATYTPLIDATMEIKLETTTAHLRLEEIINGDSNEDIDEVLKHLELATWYINAMLDGGKNQEGRFIPLDNTSLNKEINEVKLQIENFKDITNQRYVLMGAVIAGTDIDEQYDSAFRIFITQVDEVETKLQTIITTKLVVFKWTQIGLILIVIMLIIVILIIFNQYEKSKEQDSISIKKMNTDLEEDIIKRKQLEKTLIEAKETAERYLDISGSAFVSLDTNGNIVLVNQKGLKILEYEKSEELNGKNWFNTCLPSEVIEPVKQVFANVMNGDIEGVENFENEVVTKSGKRRFIYWSNSYIKDEKGQIKYLLSSGIDITERKQAEDALKESEKNYRILVETMPDGVYKSTHDGKFAETNPAMVKMLGYNSKEELLAVDIKNDLYIDDSERDNIFLDELNQELGIYQLRKKDGSVIWVEDHGWYSFDESDEITYHEGVMRDVTERIQKEQELIIAKEKAEESDRLKSAFLANMSHEIRTPMNGILGFADLLKEPNLSGEQQQKYIDIIEKGGARMLNIINNIISISKIESGQMEVNMQESTINEQIEYIYNFFKPEIEAKGLQFSFRNDLPSKESVIKTDREKVYAILTNLVKNAIKNSEKGSIEFGYSLKKTNKLAELEFYVKDTGIGIPKDRQKAIFERFIQADISDRMALQGAGLGLSISKAYVELLGGKIWVESEEGKGSTFYFTLPYQTEKIIEDSAESEIKQSVKATPMNKLKILIVEDDKSSEILILIAVQKFSKEIISVKTGTEAVEACRKNPDIDLVLMDIQLPEMNGYEATTQIRQFNKDLIIIAQTAYGLTGDREKSIASGCNDYIIKPIRKDELKEKIEKFFK